MAAGTGLAETPGKGSLSRIWGPDEAGNHQQTGPEAANGRLAPGAAHPKAPRAQSGRQLSRPERDWPWKVFVWAARWGMGSCCFVPREGRGGALEDGD